MDRLKQKVPWFSVIKQHSRLLFEDIDWLEVALWTTPWISNFSRTYKFKPDLDELKQGLFKLLKIVEFDNFKVITKRLDKSFPMNSLEISADVGWYIYDNMNKRVNLTNPEFIIYLELSKKDIYVYYQRMKWIGGLPIGSSWKVVSMLSWGIDSPVASFQMMKRWCEVIFFHAFNKTLHTDKVRNKIYDMVKRLNIYQWNSKLFMIDFVEIQRHIIDNVPDSLRMIIFKRSIVRMANKIANKINAKAIITGDSLWQVASQTLDNINTIYKVSTHPIFSPLIWADKQEIINIANSIWTYDISIQPYDDCCSLISTGNPATRWKPEIIEIFENKMNLDAIENEALCECLIKEFDYR